MFEITPASILPRIFEDFRNFWRMHGHYTSISTSLRNQATQDLLSLLTKIFE